MRPYGLFYPYVVRMCSVLVVLEFFSFLRIKCNATQDIITDKRNGYQYG